MILTAHQTVYLPWLGLFHKIALADSYVYIDSVQYLKKDWNNRNKIKMSQGWNFLTVPILSKGKFSQLLRDVKINNNFNWRKKHWKSIQLNYKKTPYFDEYSPFFEELFEKEWVFLSDLNREIMKFILKELGIKTRWIEGSTLDPKGTKTDLVIDICKKVNANIYIFGTLGRDYAEIEKFDKEGIKIIFQDYNHPTYQQQFNKFEPYLSVIDLMFNHGKDSYKIIMEGNLSRKELEEITI